MRVSRRIGDKPTIVLGSLVQIAIAGVVTVGLLVAARPAIGIALIVGVVVLVLLFGRAAAPKDEPPSPE